MLFSSMESAINDLKAVENRILNFDFIFMYGRLLCEKCGCQKTKAFVTKKLTRISYYVFYRF